MYKAIIQVIVQAVQLVGSLFKFLDESLEFGSFLRSTCRLVHESLQISFGDSPIGNFMSTLSGGYPSHDIVL